MLLRVLVETDMVMSSLPKGWVPPTFLTLPLDRVTSEDEAVLLRRNLHATYEMLEWLLFDYELSWCDTPTIPCIHPCARL